MDGGKWLDESFECLYNLDLFDIIQQYIYQLICYMLSVNQLVAVQLKIPLLSVFFVGVAVCSSFVLFALFRFGLFH